VATAVEKAKATRASHEAALKAPVAATPPAPKA
jgi:hypothetical protein